MRQSALYALALIGTMAGTCSNDGSSPHQGDSSYAWNYTPIPAAPTIDSLVAGDKRILVYFTPSTAQYFNAVCKLAAGGAYGRTGFTYKSPAPVDSLQNNVEYSCAVWAFNSGRPSNTGSAYLNATPKAP